MPEFCSAVARKSSVPLAGTATRGSAYIFLPVQKSHWGKNEINESWGSAELLRLVKESRRHGIVVRLFNPPLGLEMTAFVYSRDLNQTAVDKLHSFSRLYDIRHNDRKSIFFCVQGTRDRCCAKWGYGSFQAALQLRRENLIAYDVFECSHLGGDRFAATAVAFPSGVMYGHLSADSIKKVILNEEKGLFVPEFYRGCVYEMPIEQIIRHALASECGKSQSKLDFTFERHPLGDQTEEVTIDISADGVSHSIIVKEEEVPFYSSCNDLEVGKISRSKRLVRMTQPRYSSPRLQRPN